MQLIPVLLIVALVFGLCYLCDKAFSRLFRSKAQHRSGHAVRASKHYGVFGIAFILLGILALSVGLSDSLVLLVGGVLILLAGIGLAVYYLTFGLFYDDQSFLYSVPGKKSVTYRYEDIREQKLYQVQGGSIVVELHLADGRAIGLQSTMEGIYPFLDTAFSGWCTQTGRDPSHCPFHDPANSWWFPHEAEEEDP